MVGHISFEGAHLPRTESREAEKKREADELHEKLKKAQEKFDSAFITLGNFSFTEKILHRKEYKKALDDFQEALKLVRKIENSLGNVFITSEDTFKQLDVLNLEKPEVRRREAWEENIPPRKRE